MRLRRETFLQVLLVVIAMIGYWPVVGFENTLKWDIIDQYFPWRMFIVECLRSGVFPLWNPYEQLGTPIFADPQSGYWYAPVWLSALFGEYTLRSVQLEFFIHVALGGLGMFRLLRSFSVKGEVALFLSLGYLFSGFFIGNAQHLTYVVTGCWMPFVLWSFKRLLSEAGFRAVLRFSLFTWLLVTGGYPAFSIILFYVLAVLWVMQLWTLRGDTITIKALFQRSVGSAAMLLILLSGLIFTLWQGRDYFSRTEGLDYPVAAFGPFSPQSLISFLFPLAAVKDPEFFDTDISMSSAYLGWFCLSGFILFLFGKKNRTDWMLFAAVVLFLLCSFGRYTPVHRFLFEHVPMMDWFRFPSVFRLFAMTGILIASGLAWSRIDRLRPLVILQTIALGLVLVVFYIRGGWGGITWPSSGSLDTYFISVPFNQAVLVQAAILVPLLAVPLVVFFLRTGFRMKWMVFGCIGIIELLVFSRMNMPITVVSECVTGATQTALDSARVKGFPIPAMHPMVMNRDEGPFPFPFWKNLNLFRKEPAWDGYNNFQLRGYVRFFDQEELRNAQLSKPWVAFVDTVLTYSDSILPIRLEGRFIAYLPGRSIPVASGGISHPGNRVMVNGFEPGRMEMEAEVESDSALLVVMQQDYPGWEVRVEGSPVKAVVSDYLFQSVWLSHGSHRVEWVYSNFPVRLLTVVGWFTGWVVLLVLCMPHRVVSGGRKSVPFAVGCAPERS